jgi:hypothetical protein
MDSSRALPASVYHGQVFSYHQAGSTRYQIPGLLQGDAGSQIKIDLATDLISGIPPLSGMDPEQILNFMIRAHQVRELNLIPDPEFLALDGQNVRKNIADTRYSVGNCR